MDFFINTDKSFEPVLSTPFPLVHITRDWDTLEGIIKEGFKPKYCSEFITNGVDEMTAAFPMVSFSNISVDDAIHFQKSYGTFGIALDQSWGQENGLNPVLYLDRGSDLTNGFLESFKQSTLSKRELMSCLRGGLVGQKHLYAKVMLKIFAHAKNHDGLLVRNGRQIHEAYQFGLEREWRKIVNDDRFEYFLSGDDLKKKDEFNKQLSNIRYDFRLDQIKCLIVETENEKEAARDLILKKYSVTTLPANLEIRINDIRYEQDEG